MEQRPLTKDDYRNLLQCYISREIAEAAGIYRIASLDGRELVGHRGAGNFNGLVFPYIRAGQPVAHRLRLDHPPVVNGKADHKYLQAPGTRNRIYFPPAPTPLLLETSLPLVITEGEKKCLALWRMALETGNGTGEPAFLPISFSGVHSWHGVTGKKTNATGERVDEKGPIPDLDLITWNGRSVTILFDSNAASNPQVGRARRDLAAELTRRGAQVLLADLPPEAGINGCDDYLAAHGIEALARVLEKARLYNWKGHLMRGEKGPYSVLENAVIALAKAPEWAGVLAYDEFRMRHLAQRPTPWGKTGDWQDRDDIELACWLQRNGLMLGVRTAADAAFTAAREHPFHPVRDYLGSLEWDGTERLDKWLIDYLGVEAKGERDELYTCAVGAAWMISAVARIYDPGSKADHLLVLEGPQGSFKSTAFRKLTEPWFTDDLAPLGSKDSQLAMLGTWIIELAELDALTRSEWSRIKAFVSRQTDRFRPPYGRQLIEAPRQCIFVGTINHGSYLEDDTGGRRFWPVRCGQIQLAKLAAGRDQLWAEAVARYRRGEKWWLNSEVTQVALEKQDSRFQPDAWEGVIADWLESQYRVTTANVLESCIKKPTGQWLRSEEMRVGKILRQFGWEEAAGRNRPRVYIRKELIK